MTLCDLVQIPGIQCISINHWSPISGLMSVYSNSECLYYLHWFKDGLPYIERGNPAVWGDNRLTPDAYFSSEAT